MSILAETKAVLLKVGYIDQSSTGLISYRLRLEKLASLLDTVEVVDPTAIVTVDMTGEMGTMDVPKYVFMSQVRGWNYS